MANNKKLICVVDTNIFLRGLGDVNNTSNVEVLKLINSKKIEIIFSQETFGELIYMLKHWSRKHIDKKSERLTLLHNFTDLFYNSLSYNTEKTICPKIEDKNDEMFVKCAIEGNANFIVSNDFKSGMHSLDNIKFKVLGSKDFIDFTENKNTKSPIER